MLKYDKDYLPRESFRLKSKMQSQFHQNQFQTTYAIYHYYSTFPKVLFNAIKQKNKIK